MNLLVPLAALLGIEVQAITERVKTLAIINGAIVGFILVAFVFLLVAAFLGLSSVVSPIFAALIIAGVAMVLALAVYVGTQIGENAHRRQAAERRRSSETSAFVTTAALTALPVVLKSPVLRTLGIPAAALAAYFLLGRGGPHNPEE